MEQNSTTATDSTALFAGEAWFDPIEAGIRERVRGLAWFEVGLQVKVAWRCWDG